MLVKVTDYIADFLANNGIETVFMITGGGAMHLNDSLGSFSQFEVIFNHHEQACAIAAEGYYRASGKMAVVNVTSGPGGTNTITGVIGQWLDSIPALYLSGQVRQATTIAACPELNLRQLGDQEINIIDIVRPITKYAVMVRDPMKIGYHLERAFYLAKNGRPGPVWLDIPLDVQASMVEVDNLLHYDPEEDRIKTDENLIKSQVAEVIQHMRQAERPVLLVGNGVRLSGAVELFRELANKMNVPILTAINGHDLIWSDHPLFYGRPGIVGDRLGNLVVQNSDFLLCIGARLGVRQISYNYAAFARQAYRIMVDIDPAELKKPTLNMHLAIQSDAKYFLEELSKQLGTEVILPKRDWINWCNQRRNGLPTIFEDNSHNPDYINSYRFAAELFKQLGPGSTVVTGNGTAYTGTYQVMKINRGVRVFTNQGCAAMGYDVPAAIGACISLKKQPVVLITGDGSIQMNIQEFQTIAYHKLPLKIFVLNNNGYLAIRITQDSYFKSRHVGSEPAGGLTFPNLLKVAEAYGIPSIELHHEDQLAGEISKILAQPGPYICQIMMDPSQTLLPKLSSVVNFDGSMSSRPLEDMFPFLSRDEFNKNMFISPLSE